MEQLNDIHPAFLQAIRQKVIAWWYGYESPALSGLSRCKSRFLQWWNGETPSASYGDWGAHAQLPMRTAEAPHMGKQDVSARLIVSQTLWGEGNLNPGPADFITSLMSRLRLNSKMSMVDLGAGLGGPSRALNAAYGIWVTAYEWVEEIAAAGMEQSIMHGMGRKVPIVHFNPDTVQQQQRKIDCFFSKDALHLIEHKKPLLRSVRAALKPDGQFLIIDYVVNDHGGDSPGIAAWNQADEQHSSFWSREEYVAAFAEMRLELRVVEDMTPHYCEMIADGFRRLTHEMAGLMESETDPQKQSELRRALAYESNRWAVRAEAMHKGVISVMRFSGNIKHG